MDMSVFSLLLFSGFLGISSLSREFFYVHESKTWKDAQQHCRQVYTDLATIESMDEKERARGNVDLHFGDVWIGLQKGADLTWGWSLGENTLPQFNNWATDQPDNAFLDGHCGAMSQNGYWYAVSCFYILDIVCYDEYNDIFYLAAIVGTWKEAQVYCRKHYSDLASIRNPSELTLMSKFISSTDYMWLGLFADTWSWSDQSTSSFRYWASGKPLNLLNYSNCAVMDMSDFGSWNNLICDTKLPFLCYKVASLKKRQIVEFKVRSDGEKDLNDPLVNALILKQIDEKLRALGMANYSDLSWRETNGIVFNLQQNKTALKLPESCQLSPVLRGNFSES